MKFQSEKKKKKKTAKGDKRKQNTQNHTGIGLQRPDLTLKLARLKTEG